MEYSIRYCNSCKPYFRQFQEIIIKYDCQDIALLDFLKEYQDYRIILMVDEVKEFDIHQEWRKLNAIHEQYPEYKIEVCFNHMEAPLTELMRLGSQLTIPWFSNINIVTWDMLHYYLNCGVSQVYIAEALGFELQEVAALCHNRGVRIRVYPNVAQASVREAPALMKFFIRPEDAELYAQYIDVFEFWCEDIQQHIYRKIYQNGEWYGPLREIIKDFDCDIDSRRLLPVFGSIRINCGKRCLKGRPCHICDKLYDISKTLESSNVIIKKESNKGV